MNKRLKGKGYVRVSTMHESQKDSPEHQKGAILEHAEQLGIDIIGFFEDRDTGTAIVGRPDVQQMVKEAQEGSFDVILFSSLSRFSRDALDSISLKRMIVNVAGRRLISIEDFYDSGVEDNEMLFGVVSVVNQKLSEQISTASRRGIRQSARSGNFIGSIAPYGYKKATVDGRKTLVVDPERAPIVKKIFDLYVNRKMGVKAIVNHLNNEGIPSYRGGKWGLSSVQRVLQNEAYTGENVFGKYEIVKEYRDIRNMHDRHRKQVQRDEDEWERTSFKTHEAIISDDMFRKAQEIRLIRGGGKRGGRRQYVNVFAKMIFCKHCGCAMVSMASKSSDKYRYLMCSKRRRQGETGCVNGKWIPYYSFRDEIIGWIVTQLSKKINSEEIAVRSTRNVSFAEHDFEKEIKRYKKEIEDNRKLLFEIRRQHMLGEIDEDQYEFEKEQYEKEIQTLESRLSAAEKKAKEIVNLERLRKEAKEAVDELLSLENYEDVDKTRIILSRLIERITVDKDGQIDVYTMLEKV